MEINWSYEKLDDFKGMEIQEDYHGIPLAQNCEKPIDCFRIFFCDEILEKIAEGSAHHYEEELKLLYGEEYKTREYSKNSLPYLFMKRGINKEDILAFVGIRIFMGIHKLPSVESYWSKQNTFKNRVSDLMSVNFYKFLTSALYLPITDKKKEEEKKIENEKKNEILNEKLKEKNYKKIIKKFNMKKEKENDYDLEGFDIKEEEKNDDEKSESSSSSSSCSSCSCTDSKSGSNNNSEDENSELSSSEEEKRKIAEDPRTTVNWYLNLLIEKYQENFELGYDLTIDESMVSYKGKAQMRFYMPLKPCKYGFKLHCLVDSKTNYLYNFIIDPGKKFKERLYNTKDDSRYAEFIVLKLIENIKNGPHRLFFDGWYSSISLLTKLKQRGFLAMSILRNNTKNLPKLIKNNKDFAYSDDVLIQKYHDHKLILFVSNFKDTVDNLRNLYNVENRGVDKLNQKISCNSTNRKEYKWWKKLFLFGINSSIVNSKIIYEIKHNVKLSDLEFKTMIVNSIFDDYLRSSGGRPHLRQYKNVNISPIKKENLNVNGDGVVREKPKNNYIPKKMRNLIHSIKKEKGVFKKCAYCKKKDTNYYCEECNIKLHPECFNAYHIQNIYNISLK